MGVNPVGSTQKYFIFDGESSQNYKTHITGSGVFNAPVRNVEMVTIPNRNGAFALDNGMFDNIELTYEASIVADTVAEFADAISELRNWLCSKTGYCRLEDDYNTGEYRLACYRSGLEVEPFQATAGTFEIVFDCKPQRFLTSGETAVSVTSGDTITNPTRFASSPQLQVWGYGGINLGNETVSVENVVIGNTPVSNPYASAIQYLSASSPQRTFGGSDNPLDVSMLETGDVITIDGYSFTLFGSTLGGATISQLTVTPTNCSASVSRPNNSQYQIKVTPNAVTINKGTSVSDTELGRIVVAWSLGNGTTGTTTVIFKYRYTHTSSDDLVYWVVGYTGSIIVNGGNINVNIHADSFIGDSTKPITGNPLYIDLDIGEAWNEDSGTPVTLNYGVTIPAELPTLASGVTEITYDNTITQLKVVPRWWRV